MKKYHKSFQLCKPHADIQDLTLPEAERKILENYDTQCDRLMREVRKANLEAIITLSCDMYNEHLRALEMYGDRHRDPSIYLGPTTIAYMREMVARASLLAVVHAPAHQKEEGMKHIHTAWREANQAYGAAYSAGEKVLQIGALAALSSVHYQKAQPNNCAYEPRMAQSNLKLARHFVEGACELMEHPSVPERTRAYAEKNRALFYYYCIQHRDTINGQPIANHQMAINAYSQVIDRCKKGGFEDLLENLESQQANLMKGATEATLSAHPLPTTAATSISTIHIPTAVRTTPSIDLTGPTIDLTGSSPSTSR